MSAKIKLVFLMSTILAFSVHAAQRSPQSEAYEGEKQNPASRFSSRGITGLTPDIANEIGKYVDYNFQFSCPHNPDTVTYDFKSFKLNALPLKNGSSADGLLKGIKRNPNSSIRLWKTTIDTNTHELICTYQVSGAGSGEGVTFKADNPKRNINAASCVRISSTPEPYPSFHENGVFRAFGQNVTVRCDMNISGAPSATPTVPAPDAGGPER